MGANYGNTNSQTRKFYKIIGGQIRETVDATEAINQIDGNMNAGYIKRTNAKGVEVYEREVRMGLDGKLTKLEYENHPQYGNQIVVGLSDDGIMYELKFVATNSNRSFTDYAKSFIEQVRFLDLSKNVRVNSWKWETPDDKVKFGMSLTTESSEGSGYYDAKIKDVNADGIKEFRGSLSEPVVTNDPLNAGKKRYDWTPVSMDLYNELKAQIQRVVDQSNLEAKAAAAVPQVEKEPVAVATEPVVTQSTDELPF